jgi:hypothetical protein
MENTNKCTVSFHALYFMFMHSYMFRPFWAILTEISDTILKCLVDYQRISPRMAQKGRNMWE